MELVFGQVESMFAELHDVADEKRSAFAARLKNFIRLGFPFELETQKGKQTLFRPEHVVQLGIALEMTQLGMTPDRVIRCLSVNWFQTVMAVGMAADILIGEIKAPDGKPYSMFVFFDPGAMSVLSQAYDQGEGPGPDPAQDSYFYGPESIVKENIAIWTRDFTNRLSLINVTGLIENISIHWLGFSKKRDKILDSLSAFAHKGFSQWDKDAKIADMVDRYLDTFVVPKATLDKEQQKWAKKLSEMFGVDHSLIADRISRRIGK